MEGCEVVFHFAAKTIVSESVIKPEFYMEINLRGTENVLKTMKKLRINKFVMASTCAVYSASNSPINEKSDLGPTSPYGVSKLLADNLITAFTEKFNMSSFSFRFFNASGAYYSKDLGWLKEKHSPETHLIPNLINSTKEIKFKLFGTDWNTTDGTCIRDYVHVADIADACIKALSRFELKVHEIVNLGSNKGISVFEIIQIFEDISETKINLEVHGRREGDAEILVADSSKARELLNWSTKFDPTMIIQTCLEINPFNA
jgi:UDP-glucose 4-epimerase